MVGQAGQTNQNLEEFKAWKSNHSLRRFLPTVYGYIEQEVNGKRVSFLIVGRMGFTFADLIDRVRLEPVAATALNLIVGAATQVVNTIVQAAEGGIAVHDWHVGNIGFSDNEAAKPVLVDWEKMCLPAPRRPT